MALCPDLTYLDHLVYHYTAGVAAAALRKWDLAADLLEICASAPVGRGNGSLASAGPAGSQLGGPSTMGMGMGMSMRGEARALRPGGPGGGGNDPSAVQIDAMKKLVLVQLVHHGQLRATTKYMHAVVARVAGQNSPYGAFARAYPAGGMHQILEKEHGVFVGVGVAVPSCRVRL